MAHRSIRLFVRTKKKYEPGQFNSQLWYIDVTDFAGCAVGDIKKECHKATGAKVDDLFFLNQSLADDRSVAHYNFPDGSILETTSNPLLVSMIHVKMVEITRQQDAHPNDHHVQRWTHRSMSRKVTLLSVLFNARKLEKVQPPYFPTYEDFVIYLERLGRKGACINPAYSGADFQRWFAEHLQLDTGQSDPVQSFLARHAKRLGLDMLEAGEPRAGASKSKGKNIRMSKGKGKQPMKRTSPATARPRQPKKDRLCEDCEQNLAEIYCGSCVGSGGSAGVVLCQECTDHIHRGALHGNHDCKDISEAPKAPANPQGYIPHPYKAPFAIVLAMTRALSENGHKLSLDEEEIKQRGQPLTDTDLHDKQAGKIMGGFDCLENTLIPKKLIQKEAARHHTFALTQAGKELGQKLDVFDEMLQKFLLDSGVPSLPDRLRCTVGKRQLVLVVDERERDLPRLRLRGLEAGISVVTRNLPVADYVWVLSPELNNLNVPYDGRRPEQEILLPVLVERKSWTDLHDSMRLGRWDVQIGRMKACGFPLNFLLVEGCVRDLRHVTQDRRDRLQAELEHLTVGAGFYVSHTFCWSKSATWLFWMTHILADSYSQGQFDGETILFSELATRLSRGQRERNAGCVVHPLKTPGSCDVWEPDHFVSAIFSESLGEKEMAAICGEFFQNRHMRHLLLLQDFEAYYKNRHALLHNCLRQVFSLETCDRKSVGGIVEGHLMGHLKDLIHFDVIGYWTLFLQVNQRVYVVRTESEEDTQRIRGRFSHSGRHTPNGAGNNLNKTTTVASIGRKNQCPGPRQWVQTAEVAPSMVDAVNVHSAASISHAEGEVPQDNEGGKTLQEEDFATDSQTEDRMLQEALSLSLISSMVQEDESDSLPVPSPSSTPPPSHLSPSGPCHHTGEIPPSMSPSCQSLQFTASLQTLDIIPPTLSQGAVSSQRGLEIVPSTLTQGAVSSQRGLEIVPSTLTQGAFSSHRGLEMVPSSLTQGAVSSQRGLEMVPSIPTQGAVSSQRGLNIVPQTLTQEADDSQKSLDLVPPTFTQGAVTLQRSLDSVLPSLTQGADSSQRNLNIVPHVLAEGSDSSQQNVDTVPSTLTQEGNFSERSLDIVPSTLVEGGGSAQKHVDIVPCALTPEDSNSQQKVDIVPLTLTQEADGSQRSLDIVPPTLTQGSGSSQRSLSPNRSPSSSHTEEDSVSMEVGASLGQCALPSSVDSGDGDMTAGEVCTLGSGTSSLQESHTERNGGQSPLGFSMDDPIMIDSQGLDDDRPSSMIIRDSGCKESIDEGSVCSSVTVDDEALARKLQEEEDAKRILLPHGNGNGVCDADRSQTAILAHSQTGSSQNLPIPTKQSDSQSSITFVSAINHGEVRSAPKKDLAVSPLKRKHEFGAEGDLCQVVPEKKVKSQPETDEEFAQRLQRELDNEVEEENTELSVLHVSSDVISESSRTAYKGVSYHEDGASHCGDKDRTTCTLKIQPEPQESCCPSVLPDSWNVHTLNLSVNACTVSHVSDGNTDSQQKLDRKKSIDSLGHTAEPSSILHSKLGHVTQDHDLKRGDDGSCVDDEALARKLQEEEEHQAKRSHLEMNTDLDSQLFDTQCVQATWKENGGDLNTLYKMDSSYVDEDEELARRLQAQETAEAEVPISASDSQTSFTMASSIPSLLRVNIVDTSEDELLARRLQEQEEIEAQKSTAKSKSNCTKSPTAGSSRRRTRQRDFMDLSVQDDELLARKLQEEGDASLKMSDYVQRDEELARKLQDEESIKKKKVKEVGMDVLNSEDSKSDLMKQLEYYRKTQEVKHSAKKNQTRQPSTASTPGKSHLPYPTSTSTPKTTKHTPKKFGQGVLKPGATSPSTPSSSTHGGKKFSVSPTLTPNRITSADKKCTVISSVHSSLANKQDNKSGCTEYTCQSVSGLFSFRGMTRHSASNAGMKTESRFAQRRGLAVDRAGIDASPLPRKKASATITSSGATDHVGAYCVPQSREHFLDSRGENCKPSPCKSMNSSQLSTANMESAQCDMNNSIDLTDEDLPMVAQSTRRKSVLSPISMNEKNACGSVCKDDSSVLFPTFDLPDQVSAAGRLGKTEKGAVYIQLDDDDDDDMKMRAVSGWDLKVKPEMKSGSADGKYEAADACLSSDTGSSAIVSNVKCGSCGQKGHNRRFERCPNYYTEKEKNRRDAIEEAQRRRVEERAREAEERQREEQRALHRLAMTRDTLQRNKEMMMQQIAAATQECASQFQSQLNDIDRLMTSKERKIKGYQARQRRN